MKHPWGIIHEKKVRTRSGYHAYHMRRWLRLLRRSQLLSSYPFSLSLLIPWGIDCNTKSVVTSDQFRLLNPLSQFHLQSTWLRTSKSKWLSLTVILQLQSHCWGHPSTWSHISVTKWLTRQMHYDAQNKSIKEAVHFWGLLPIQSNLPRQFRLFLA